MSAHAAASTVVHLSTASDETFLKNAAEQLERLLIESDARGHGLLASLIAIAQGEAEDDLRTSAKEHAILGRDQDRNDGAEKIAQKFAYRKRKRA